MGTEAQHRCWSLRFVFECKLGARALRKTPFRVEVARRMLHYLTSALRGPKQALAAHRHAMSMQPGIISGVERLLKACPVVDTTNDDEPIFLLSAGWRSGSTLLQRLIMSDARALI